jgi:hypothetical protein
MTPQRIQRQRAKGWRAPENTVYVGPGSRWGTPFKIYRLARGEWVVLDIGRGGARERIMYISGEPRSHPTSEAAREAAAALYTLHIGPMGLYEFSDEALDALPGELADRNLMCWCPPGPCHADVLLELANR